MRKFILPIVVLLILSSCFSCSSSRIHEVEEWDEIFNKYGIDSGAFIIRDHTHDEINYNNLERVSIRRCPASTFKIMNALIAVEQGLLQDDKHIIPWDGVKREREEWNQDLTLRAAFRASAVPYFQEVARRIGAERMQHYLDTVRYGNKNINGALDQFWLNDTLQITADEQVGLLKRLYFNELPFSDRTQRIVRSLMIQEDTPDGKLYYKTGTKTDGPQQTYWIVGFTEQHLHMKEHENSMNKSNVRIYPYMFAMNFVTTDTTKDWYNIRLQLLKDLLRAAEAWK